MTHPTAMLIQAVTICEGEADAPIALLDTPLSLWGGYDLDTGEIVDATHPQAGAVLKGRILAMRSARGSSSSSSTLLEAVRRGTAPAAIVLAAADPILAIGAIVAADLYGARLPVVLCSIGDWDRLVDGQCVRIAAGRTSATIDLSCGRVGDAVGRPRATPPKKDSR